MKKKLAFVFKSLPHSDASGREGLDALLAASAYTEDLAVFFLADGVNQLRSSQSPTQILCRDYIATFKLLELYDIEQVYVCEQSLAQWGLSNENLLIDMQVVNSEKLTELLSQCQTILTF